MYNSKKTKKVMISGDTGKKNYDEVKAMQIYLRNRGIPASDIIVDIQGDTTFDSIKHLTLFNFQHISITTQEFHLPRAVFIAQSLGLSVDGIISDRSAYIDEKRYELRESFSRLKAFIEVLGRHIGIR
jgi:SanA protein